MDRPFLLVCLERLAHLVQHFHAGGDRDLIFRILSGSLFASHDVGHALGN
jgi:hypothetical protein